MTSSRTKEDEAAGHLRIDCINQDVAAVKNQIEELHKKNMDVNVRLSGTQSTALIEASIWSKPEIVRILIDAKADIDAKNIYGNTALSEAVSRGRSEIVDILIEAKADLQSQNKNALIEAARNGHLELIFTLISKKCDVNTKGGVFNDRSPLSIACEHGQLAAVNLLLEAKANCSTKDKKGHDIMYYIAGSKYEVDILKILRPTPSGLFSPKEKEPVETTKQVSLEESNRSYIPR